MVARAQSGDAQARDILFERFEWFLKKYRSFFRSEADAIRLARQYPDIAAFLGLFMGKRTYHAVQSRRWSPSLTADVARKVNEVCELARELGGEEDMNVIIDMTFLELLNKYDEKGKVRKELKKKGIDYDALSASQKARYEAQIPPVGFEGYIINVFKWRLFKNIEAESKGVIPGVGWCKPYVTSPDQEENEEVNLAEHLSEDDTEMLTNIADLIHIDHDWISGKTCVHPFDALSQQDRWILKMKFVDRMSSREIGESIGASPSVVRSRFNEIMNKLKAQVETKEWVSKKTGERFVNINVKNDGD